MTQQDAQIKEPACLKTKSASIVIIRIWALEEAFLMEG